MKREKSPYEESKSIMDDEATYEDYNTILLINLITEIVVKITLARAEAIQRPGFAQLENH